MLTATLLLETLGDWLHTVAPLDCFEARFMQMAFFGLLLLAPTTAMLGLQVVHFRMAFFSDAISHSAFAGIAVGLILGLDPGWTMPLFAILVGVGIVALERRSSLSTDTVIGVIFSGMVAFGLAVISRDRNLARDMQRFLYGDILTLSPNDLVGLVVLLVTTLGFQFFGFNRMLAMGLNRSLAEAHRLPVRFYQYGFAILLSLTAIFAVRTVGIFLVTALLLVPAATARLLARSAGGTFWWAMLLSLVCAFAGFWLSAQDWMRTATGATVVLASVLLFFIVLGFRRRIT